MSYVIELPFATPSQNSYQRWHWGRQSKWLDTARLWIRQRLNAAGHFAQKPSGRMRLTIRRFSAGRLDRGNFVGGCKPLLDALRYEGVMIDDREECLDDHYEQHEAPRGKARTEVEVEPCS